MTVMVILLLLLFPELTMFGYICSYGRGQKVRFTYKQKMGNRVDNTGKEVILMTDHRSGVKKGSRTSKEPGQ